MGKGIERERFIVVGLPSSLKQKRISEQGAVLLLDTIHPILSYSLLQQSTNGNLGVLTTVFTGRKHWLGCLELHLVRS